MKINNIETKNKKKRIQEQIHNLNMFCYEGFWAIFITHIYKKTILRPHGK